MQRPTNRPLTKRELRRRGSVAHIARRRSHTGNAFTLVEMLVAVSIFSMIFGLAGMLYVQSTWRAANAMEMNAMITQVRNLDQWLENTIQQSNNVQSLSRGLPLLSATALEFTMPSNGSSYDQFGLYNAYTPSSCSTGIVHWGSGNNRWLYFSDSSGNYSNSGTYLTVNDGHTGSPAQSNVVTNFTFYGGNTNIYRYYLIDNFTFSVNSVNHSVTYMIHASDLTRTGQAVGTNSADTANSHSFQVTRTVYWRNSTT